VSVYRVAFAFEASDLFPEFLGLQGSLISWSLVWWEASDWILITGVWMHVSGT
jgi:hypothetical protein